MVRKRMHSHNADKIQAPISNSMQKSLFQSINQSFLVKVGWWLDLNFIFMNEEGKIFAVFCFKILFGVKYCFCWKELLFLHLQKYSKVLFSSLVFTQEYFKNL